MKVLRRPLIYREQIVNNRDWLFIFGDNLERVGWGGQAAEMRGEVNSIGIATKRSISHSYPDDYFFDHQEDVIPIIDKEFEYLHSHIKRNKVLTKDQWETTNRYVGIVIPTAGVGTGLSKMPKYAPKALEYIESKFKELETL